jgi:hypothetical protein
MIFDDTIDAMVDAITASPSFTGVAVADGPLLLDVAAGQMGDRIFVGASDDATNLAAEGTNDPPEGVVGVIDMDHFAVICQIECTTGDNVPRPTRVRAFALLQALRTLFRANTAMVTLGIKGLSSVHVGAWQFTQVQTDKGFYASITVRIECVASPSTA